MSKLYNDKKKHIENSKKNENLGKDLLLGGIVSVVATRLFMKFLEKTEKNIKK